MIYEKKFGIKNRTMFKQKCRALSVQGLKGLIELMVKME